MTFAAREAVSFVAVAMALAPTAAHATALSSEVDIGDRIQWRAGANQRSVTFDGCQIVIVAEQTRLIGDAVIPSDTRVYASRVDRAGNPLDRFGVPVDFRSGLAISNGPETVAVETGGVSFDNRVNPATFARLGPDLRLLGRRTLDIPADATPTLACSEGNCLLFGKSTSGSSRSRLVDFMGVTVADGILPVDNGGWLSGPLMVTVPGGYAIEYTDQIKDGVQGVFVARIANGTRAPVKASAVRQIPGKPMKSLALAQGQSGLLLVVEDWPDPLLTVPAKLFAVITGAPAPIELASDGHDYEVDAFADRDRFVVAFRQPAFGTTPAGATTVARVSAGGVLDMQSTERAFGPAVTTPEGRFVLDPLLDLHEIAADGTETGSPIPTMAAHYPELQPRLITGTSNMLLTYRDRDAANHYWHAIRLSADGAPLDASAPPVITTSLDPTPFVSTTVPPLQAAFDGAAFVLGSLDASGNLILTHEDPESGTRDTPMNLGPVGTDFQLHSGAHGILVTWGEGRSCGEDCGEGRLLGLPIDTSGKPTVGTPAVLVDWTSTVGDVGTADFDGSRWVVPRAGFSSIELSTITADGTVTRTSAWNPGVLFGQPLISFGHPRIAWSGGEHLLTFEQRSQDATSGMVDASLALRLDENLAPLDQTPLSLSPDGASGVSPEVVFDGTRFVVSWFLSWSGSGGGLAATFIAPDGALGGGDCFIAAKDAWSAETLASIPGTSGGAILGYTRLDPDPNLVSFRVKLRKITEGGDDSLSQCAQPGLAIPGEAPFSRLAVCKGMPVPAPVSKTSAGCGCTTSARTTAPSALTITSILGAMALRRRARSKRRDAIDRDCAKRTRPFDDRHAKR